MNALAPVSTPFSAEALEKIETSVANYQRFARVAITYTVEGHTVHVHATQTAPAPNGRILTHDELAQRVEQVFAGLLPEGFQLYMGIKPLQ